MKEKFEDIVKEEIAKTISSLDSQITDPVQKAAVARMVQQLSMMPVRLARGEDVSAQFASLQAEAAMRGVSASLKAQSAIQQAWMNILLRVVALAITAI